MSVPDLSAKLPPPHDEEPAQLRSDILDELQDHLSCAAERERRRLQMSDQPADQASVWVAVIERFGDPSALAPRLWFDAMKGRLMTQRVLIGMVSILTLLVAVLVWRSFFYVPQPLIDERALAAIIERVRKEVATPPAVAPQDLIPVKYRLVLGTADGPPVVGQAVILRQNAQVQNGVSRLGEMTEVTNTDGIADFGNLPYGTYIMRIDTPAGRLDDIISMRPERSVDIRIVVPNLPPMAEVKFEFSPPDMTNWKWKDQPPVENISPCLHVRCVPTREIQVNGKTWDGAPLAREFLVTQKGIFRVKPDSKVASVVTESEVSDSVQLPAVEMKIRADWYYPTGKNDNGMAVPPQSKDSQVYQYATWKLDQHFVDECREKAKTASIDLPSIITPKPGTSPTVIRFSSDHPGLF